MYAFVNTRFCLGNACRKSVPGLKDAMAHVRLVTLS
jgi:hypothetical protein